jgi:hypothetical protein
MGWLFNRGSDRDLAADRYAGRESATESAARQRRSGHRRSIGRIAREGQAWEDHDRQQYPSTTSWFRRR